MQCLVILTEEFINYSIFLLFISLKLIEVRIIKCFYYKEAIFIFLINLLTTIKNHDILFFVENNNILEAYPSLAEGIGLENRQAG